MRFRFGKDGLDVNLPDRCHYHTLEVCSPPPVPDISQAISRALEKPLYGPSLRDLARGRNSAAIAICDITRPAPNPLVLPPLLEVLAGAGIPDENIVILIATGLHRVATAEEVQLMVGPRVAARYKVLSHNAKNDEEHRTLGKTAEGTPVAIDERFMDADLHITLGLIEPHLMLGFSGGRKLIAPGLAHHTTIKTIHSPAYMQDARTTEGCIDSNPLHRELLEIARMARHDFMLDVTLDSARQISGIFSGAPEPAHASGVDFIRNSMCSFVDAPMDAVITSAAGFPLDLTFYQAGKGITAAQHIVKPGGRILLLAECAEGIGSDEFAAQLRHFPDPNGFLNDVRNKPVAVDQWQLEKLALVLKRYEVFFWTPGARPSELGSLKAHCYSTLSDALEGFMAGLSPDARIGLLPDGPYVFARVRA